MQVRLKATTPEAVRVTTAPILRPSEVTTTFWLAPTARAVESSTFTPLVTGGGGVALARFHLAPLAVFTHSKVFLPTVRRRPTRLQTSPARICGVATAPTEAAGANKKATNPVANMPTAERREIRLISLD